MDAKCDCNHCGGHIVFDEASFEISGDIGDMVFGQMVNCPHCNKETMLSKSKHPSGFKDKPAGPPAVPPAKPAQQKTTPPVQSGAAPSMPYPYLTVIVLMLAGFGLLLNGCVMETRNAIHQVYSGLQFCTGFVLIGIAALVDVIARK